ncbi:MAG TPA: hypothetical protein PKA82_09635 [Pyrinomonadaceae bacterium]|nr:hypothetical protein [Pyrinomonadaceae bacterium]
MGYYMRFISKNDLSKVLNDLERHLKGIDANFKFERSNDEDSAADILYRNEPYSQVEVNVPNDGLFEEEIGELQEFIEDIEGPGKEKVVDLLQNAKTIVCFQILFGGRTTDETLDTLAPIWHWLFGNYPGLLQADGEGYWENTNLILEVE